MNADQREAALKLANTIRLRNAETKQRISGFSTPDGCRLVADMLFDPDGPALTIQVGPLVEAIRGIGPYVSGPMLCQAGIYRHSRHVRDLTDRQKQALANLLRERALTYRPKVTA